MKGLRSDMDQILDRICERVKWARTKHAGEWTGNGKYYALGVIADEMREFEHAVLNESTERQEDEALDVIATCVRFLAKEYEACPR